MNKRRRDDEALSRQKRAKPLNALVATPGRSSSTALTTTTTTTTTARVSSLPAVNLQLTGHEDDVLGVEFSSDGRLLYSCSKDGLVLGWDVYSSTPGSVGVYKGATRAVTSLATCASVPLASASADGSVRVWDIDSQKGSVLARLDAIVNDVAVLEASTLVAAVDDSGALSIRDARSAARVCDVALGCPLTAVALASSPSGPVAYVGGVDGILRKYDAVSGACVLELAPGAGAGGSLITSITVAESGASALSRELDGLVRVWDVQAFAPPSREVRAFSGPHGPEDNVEMRLLRACMAPDAWLSKTAALTGASIAYAGSLHGSVYAWNTLTGALLSELPGHSAAVLDVAASPIEPILASASADGTLMVGELDPSISTAL